MPGLHLPSEEEFDTETDDFIRPNISKVRKYSHFDLPLRHDERNVVFDFSNEASPHRFFPLLGFTDEKRKFFVDEGGKVKVKVKPRRIRFAGHRDSAYLQAYGEHLSELYETKLVSEGLDKCVLAYRRGGSTNIHHTKALFDEIKGHNECKVFALDISGFFDNLNHSILKNEVCGLINADRLISHDWTVFSFVTKYSWVEISEIEKLLGKKRKRLGRICCPDDFKQHVRGLEGLVQKHEFDFGIPQGTPVSGLYANIYMLSFDKQMKKLLEVCGGTYRRYSDDIAIVIPKRISSNHVVNRIEKLLAEIDLSLSPDKTDEAYFSGSFLRTDRPIQYLGFVFDGQRIIIRESSLDAYRAKMQRGIHAKLVAARQKHIPSSKVFKRELFSRYTHLGKRRNFLKYAYRASEVLDAPEIRQQVKAHTTWFNRAWKREVKSLYGDLVV